MLAYIPRPTISREARERVDDHLTAALTGRTLTINELIAAVKSSSLSTRDLKTRVLQMIPQTIELTPDLRLKLTSESLAGS